MHDWHEVYEPASRQATAEQAARCMSCGTPFCHSGCPMGNLIPEWNDLVHRERWQEASDRLHATNNFPEVTGRVCPALCEASCVLSINDQPVTVAPIEKVVAEIAWTEGWVVPRPAAVKTGRRVAVVGSGPAGLAAAQQLARAGHHVVVYERADRLGGLLRYGIPEFKLEKWVLERRLDQMRAEGISFETGDRGGHRPPRHRAARRGRRPAAGRRGERWPGDLRRPRPGAWPGSTRRWNTSPSPTGCRRATSTCPPISARGRHVVVIIGGGDTGADCLGTALRQGAASVHQLEIMPRPPDHRDPSTPWPVWPLQLRTSAAHEEGGDRLWSVSTQRFVDDGRGHVAGLVMAEVAMTHRGWASVLRRWWPGPRPISTATWSCSPSASPGRSAPRCSAQLGVDLDHAWQRRRATTRWSTGREGVFVCGDMSRGQSLVAWAIAEGRSAAAAVDRWLMGETVLRTAIPAALGR